MGKDAEEEVMVFEVVIDNLPQVKTMFTKYKGAQILDKWVQLHVINEVRKIILLVDVGLGQTFRDDL